MFSVRALPLARAGASFARRNVATSYVAAQKASDPIQQLFVDKVREYADKKKKAGGKLVDATPQVRDTSGGWIGLFSMDVKLE